MMSGGGGLVRAVWSRGPPAPPDPLASPVRKKRRALQARVPKRSGFEELAAVEVMRRQYIPHDAAAWQVGFQLQRPHARECVLPRMSLMRGVAQLRPRRRRQEQRTVKRVFAWERASNTTRVKSADGDCYRG